MLSLSLNQETPISVAGVKIHLTQIDRERGRIRLAFDAPDCIPIIRDAVANNTNGELSHRKPYYWQGRLHKWQSLLAADVVPLVSPSPIFGPGGEVCYLLDLRRVDWPLLARLAKLLGVVPEQLHRQPVGLPVGPPGDPNLTVEAIPWDSPFHVLHHRD